MVHVTPEGTIYAFIAGSGLLKAEEPGFQWTPVSNDFGGALVLHLAAGKGDETQRRLYVVTFDPETRAQADRTSVVEGKSVSVRVDLGGRRIIKKTGTIGYQH